jgi:hypothetical protein
MLYSKFFITIIGLILTIFAIKKVNMSSDKISEGWGMNPPRGVQVVREVSGKFGDGTCGAYSLQNNHQAIFGNNKFISTPSFQANLSPRMSSVDIGAHINYNYPSYKNLGVPCSPLAFGDMARENFEVKENYGCSSGKCGSGCGCSGVASCGKGGVPLHTNKPLKPISQNSNYVQAMNKAYSEFGDNSFGSATMPVGDMTTLDALGNQHQPVMYDRYIYYNQKQRNQSLGDMIRGDLPIQKCGMQGWFNTSLGPKDLQQGALNVIAGVDNCTSQSVAEMQYISSGGYDDTHGGINMSNQFETTLGAGMGDVKITSFP